MEFKLWGFQSIFFLRIPLRPEGLVLLAGEILIFLFLLLLFRRSEKQRNKVKMTASAGLFFVLLLLAPLCAELFTLRLSAPTGLMLPGVPAQPQGPLFALPGYLPWVMAAGLLGGWQAMLIGFVGGLARGGWETFSVLTPLHFAFAAALMSTLVRQQYREWPARLMRHPLLASLCAGLFISILNCIDLFMYTPGDFYDALNFALGNAPYIFIAVGFESGLAGLIAEIVKESSWQWVKPAKLITAPYNRSLSRQMVTGILLAGILSSAVMLYGDWILAHQYAKQLMVRQVEQSAHQIGASVPYFVQSGRSLSRQYAEELSVSLQAGDSIDDMLDQQLRVIPFFNYLALYNNEGEVVASVGEVSLGALSSLELDAGLEMARNGIPQESTVRASATTPQSGVAFFVPVVDPSGRNMVLLGWTTLAANPYLVPVISRIHQEAIIETYLTDANGDILIHPNPARIAGRFDFTAEDEGNFFNDTAPDGSRRMVYIENVEGYPWYVVMTIPQSEVDQLAIQLTFQLAAVLLLVGLVLVGSVYVVSRQLTRPLGRMAHVAESIARGKLDLPVRSTGEDEIGRLGVSFEGMRRSLKARLGEMDLLLAASQALASTLDLSRVLPEILDNLAMTLQATEVRLILATDHENLPEMVVYHSHSGDTDWGKMDDQILELCRERGRFLLENPARAGAVLRLDDLLAPPVALLAFPLRSEDTFVGSLWLGFREAHAISSDETNLLTILTTQLGVSIANAHLYQRAEQERYRLTAILEATPDAVIVIDAAGHILLANPASEMVLREAPESVHGLPASEVLTSPELIDLLNSDSKQKHTVEVPLKDGRIYFAVLSEAESSLSGSADRVVVLADVTHFKKLDSLKSEFVSTVSHDLRAPLTLMHGYITMLSMVGDLNQKQRDFVDKILGSTDQMSRLVDNLLDLRRIEAGLGLKLEDVRIENLVREVVLSHRPQALNKKISLEVELPDTLLPVQADEVLLRQAIANLIDNAIKYTPPGGCVDIRAGQKNDMVWIQVQDNGVGIAPADQARLFEKFFRPQRPGSEAIEGTGLGLAIVKSIAEQHGGKVRLESRLGEGSAFTMILPLPAISGDESGHESGHRPLDTTHG